ncbi:PREDICTED: gamma-glutamylcyclotransferase-like [Priapulus caudatus]|uniref:gamma-glutamylcyclotransferase n=1 Tax=Priapulus caudatus TaxID=37621 RepID=A0ABM1DY14_PRICU|nr:PREDICTED: gamma-glutamylcyclotransferase-like [Priapulus caudatus]
MSSPSLRSTFLYFGYGSNLLKERLCLANPSAVMKGVGKLKDYKLGFNGSDNKKWKGATATICENPGSHVYGVVWQMDEKDKESLDRQESVPKMYRPITVHVEVKDEILTCRSYQLTLPWKEGQLPSTVYKNVIIKGAIQSELPQEYIEQLTKLDDNGFNGDVDVVAKLNQLHNIQINHQ